MSAAEDVGEISSRLEQLLVAHPPATTPRVELLGAQFDAGLAWVHFPVGHGGLGLPVQLHGMIRERLDGVGAPNPQRINTSGYGQGAATIVAYGTDDQKSRYLRPLFTCEEIWCQLFSEPGSGSDLAGLSTMAVRDGDEWVVNGQKVWTTRGHLARFGMLLARTDPNVEKHKGITFFVCDMHAPGVEVRPLRQMTGEGGFSEVFLTDVRIPDANRLGDEGQGWAVSNTTLMNERNQLFAPAPRGGGAIGAAVAAWRRRSDTTSPAAMALRADLLKLWVEAEVDRLTSMRASENRVAGTPGPESSIGGLSSVGKRLAALTMSLLGMEGTLYGSYEMTQPTYGLHGDEPDAPPDPHPLNRAFLTSVAGSILAGTSEIRRNVQGERVLGLPREPAVDRGIPWSEIRRN